MGSLFNFSNEILFPEDKFKVSGSSKLNSIFQNDRMKINSVKMSSKVLYFHNILSREEAEEKLVADGNDKTYLARRSSLNEDYYILSYQYYTTVLTDKSKVMSNKKRFLVIH